MKLYKKQFKNSYKLIKYEQYKSYTISGKINNINKEKICKILDTNIDNIDNNIKNSKIFEIYRISNYNTAEEDTILNIFKKCNIEGVDNVSIKKVYKIETIEGSYNLDELKEHIFNKYHDKMIETYKILNYNNNILTDIENKHYTKYDIKKLNDMYGLSFDNDDIEYISKHINNWNNKLFILFDLSQSNSEHCRHNYIIHYLI